VILDGKGNIFGGFTPVEWESNVWGEHKADDSQKSFLFTLKNPHNIPARRFALKDDWKHQAICCDSKRGPCLGSDLVVLNSCDTNTHSSTFLGSSYINDTRLDGRVVLTDSEHFQVKEIEVFEITK
jgi:hypothetical protein